MSEDYDMQSVVSVRLKCTYCYHRIPCHCAQRRSSSVHFATFFATMEEFLRKMSADPFYADVMSTRTVEQLRAEMEAHLSFKDELWVAYSYRRDGHHVIQYPYPTADECLSELTRMGLIQLGFEPREMGTLAPQWADQKAGILEQQRLRQAIHYLATLVAPGTVVLNK